MLQSASTILWLTDQSAVKDLLQNDPPEAKDAAAAASKTERDKLEKDIKKTIKDNESVIRRNKNLVDNLMKQRG